MSRLSSAVWCLISAVLHNRLNSPGHSLHAHYRTDLAFCVMITEINLHHLYDIDSCSHVTLIFKIWIELISVKNRYVLSLGGILHSTIDWQQTLLWTTGTFFKMKPKFRQYKHSNDDFSPFFFTSVDFIAILSKLYCIDSLVWKIKLC
jgi:hypothetical protein